MMDLLANSYNKVMNSSLSHLMYSVIWIVFFLLLYFLVNQILTKKVDDRLKRKRTKVNVRNILLIILTFILISLWAGQIKTMLLSTAAITAAVIITFKEVILSFFASFYITSNKLLMIGDEVEFESIKGKVIDRNFSGIKIQTFNVEDNKIIFIPNIVFLTNKVMNYSKFNSLKLNSVVIGLENPKDAIEFSRMLENVLPPLLSFNLEEFKSNFEKINSGDVYDLFTLKKNYHIKKDFSDPLKSQLKISFYAKKEDKAEIENSILNVYYNFLTEKKNGN